MESRGQLPPPLRRTAWAKVNLTLHVIARRTDGYHELDSLIVFAGCGDELEFTPAKEISLSIEGPFAPALGGAAPEDNLAMRAARRLRAHGGTTAGARIALHKALPVAAGLGGGSADAAATLQGLNALWGLGASDTDLARIGLDLGADVPVCLDGRPSMVGGIGERIAPVPALPPAWLVLVNPDVGVATPAVFAARQGAFATPISPPGALRNAAGLARWLTAGRNDLEVAARGLAPEIGHVLAALGGVEDCLLARMSGSGATCFGLFAARAPAEAAAARLRAAHGGWWVRATEMRGTTRNYRES